MKRAALGHGIAGVDREVDEHLLELSRIDFDLWERRLQRRRQPNLSAHRSREHCLHLHHHAVEVHALDLHHLPPPEGEQLTCECARALRRRQQFRHLLRRTSILEDLTVSNHDGQQVVEVVSDVTGQCPDRFDALNGLKVLLAALEIALGVHAFDLAGDAAGEELKERCFLGHVFKRAACDHDHRADDLVPGPDERYTDVSGGADRCDQRIGGEEGCDVRAQADTCSLGQVLAGRSGDREVDVVARFTSRQSATV